MGHEYNKRSIQSLGPWVFMLLVILSFIVEAEGIITTVLCLLFSTLMAGYVVVHLIRTRWELDIWERSMTMVMAGVAIPFVAYSAINLLMEMTWNTMTVLIILPLVAVAIFVMMLLRISPLINAEKGRSALSGLKQEFLSLSKMRQVMAVLAVVSIILIGSACAILLIGQESVGFTEFYMLNQDGHAYDFPRDIGLGENATIIIGIVNHEGRAINYTVEVWLVNYTNINMAVNVTQMYYVQSLSVVLDHLDYDLNDPWVPQYEAEVVISPAVPGEYQLFIMLFADDAQVIPGPTPPDPTLDLSNTEASWRIVMCVNNEINYLMIYVEVST